jgi:peroxiredoxin
MSQATIGASAVNLNDLLSHYGRVTATGAMREVDRAIRAFSEGHMREMPTPPLGPGDIAPDVLLSDEGATAAAPKTLSSLLASGPVVLKFYRGRWCPYCTLELRAWQRELDRLAALHGRLVAISPQCRAETESTRQRDELTMMLASDPGNEIARQFGIAYDVRLAEQQLMQTLGVDLAVINEPASGSLGGGWSLALPALYVIGQDRRIAFSFVAADYRSRAEPGDVIAVVAALDASGRLNRPGRAPGSCE